MKFLKAKQRAHKSSEELALFDDAKMTLPKGIRPSTSVTTLAELDETIESAKNQQLVSALNILQGSTRRQALKVVYQSSQNSSTVEHPTEKRKNAEMKARKQTFLEASLAASRGAITHSNIEGLELPKQGINDRKFAEKVDLTCEEIYKGIEEELKIEQKMT